MTAQLFLEWAWHVALIVAIPLLCGVGVLWLGERLDSVREPDKGW